MSFNIFSVALSAALIATSLATPLSDAGAATRDTQGAQGAGAQQARAHVRPLASRSKPLAFGYVTTNGTVTSGTPNFTAAWNPNSQWYEIVISNTNYYYSSFSTNVTASIPTGVNCLTDSVSGKLLVICTNPAGAPVQADFGFVTF